MSEHAHELEPEALEAAAGVEIAPPPSYVQTEEQRSRWLVCLRIAEAMSEQGEESGKADPQFVWQTTRTLYHSDVPTGSADELDETALERLGSLPQPPAE